MTTNTGKIKNKQQQRAKFRPKIKPKRMLIYILVIMMSIWVAFPFAWLIDSSLKPNEIIFAKEPKWFPEGLSLSNYVELFTRQDFMRALRNSVFVGVISAITATMIASLAAYALARFRLPGRRIVTISIIISMLLPRVLLLLPIFLVWTKLGLFNTRLGLVIAFSAGGMPFAVLMLRSYFQDLPEDLEEQAMVDGASRLGALWRITLPLAAPALVAVFITNFLRVWNDVTMTVFLTRTIDVQTVSVFLYRQFNTYRTLQDWGVILSQTVIITLPTIFLFFILQKYFVRGITAGAIKA
jgi:ABC-type glycerol-3-phosphate transport system permease component